MSEERNFKNAIMSFYRLKNAYEKKYDDFVNKLARNKELSKKEKQQKVASFKKKCISCNKDGGSVFTITGEELKASCGNTSDPCDLNINIKRGAYSNIEENVDLFKNDTEESKTKIIIAKMNLLFGYKSENETENEFDDLKKDFDLNFTIYQEQLLELQNVLNDSMKKVELKRQSNDIVFLIEQMKQVMETYRKKPDDVLIKDVVETYQNRLRPLLQKHMETKYIINKMELNEEDGTYHLIQKKHDLAQLYTMTEDSQVLSFKASKVQ
jgi:hypothetical protein